MMDQTLSIILPAYNEAAVVPIAAARIKEIMDEAAIPYQILLVDDGSSDSTWDEIQKASQIDTKVCGLRFSRNYGKEAAMFAGLEAATGACCVILDCDLQHPPEKIVEMYQLWQRGYEVVEGIKSSRGQEGALHRFAASRFYALMSRATGVDMANTSDFKLLDRKVVDALNALPERQVFFRALSFWVGFRRTTVSYEVQERVAGATKWSVYKLVQYALTNIASFSSAPMQIVTWIGVFSLVGGLILGINTLVNKLSGTALDGFTTVILVQLIGFGLLFLSLGIIGYYVARIYDEIKGRPRYIIAERTNSSER